MNLRRAIIFGCGRFLGFTFPALYSEFLSLATRGDPTSSATHCLSDLLLHCKHAVPYYAERMAGLTKDDIIKNPEDCLQTLPLLTKAIIREDFDRLKSTDLEHRKWYYNTSGGSTGVPIRLIQDREYRSRSRAVTMLFSHFADREEGEPVMFLWGSEREILASSIGIKAKFPLSSSIPRG